MATDDINKNGKIRINDIEITVYDDSEITGEIQQLQAGMNALNQDKHTHPNKTILDKIEQSGAESAIDLSKLSTHETAINDLTSLSHPHSNKSSLDRLGISTSNRLTIDGNEQSNTEYIHPETHPASMITEDETHRFVTDDEKETWNSKAAAPFRLEDYSVDESIEYLIPLDVIELQTTHITKNSITLSWKTNPRSSDPLEYLIYSGEALVGTTSETSFEIKQLTSSTPYTLKVDSRNGDIKSNGRSIVTKTQGDFVLSLRGGTDYVETPPITFDAMEIICSLTPKVNSWSNYLIEGTTSGIQIYTQHNGASYRRSGCDLYVNGKFEPSTSFGIIPSGEMVTVRIEGKEEQKITDRFNLFASINNTTTMQGLLFRVKLYTRNGRGDLILMSDYDFTNKPPTNYVTDLLNNSPALLIHGSLFIEN
jgi:hypothetical protein